ncbi:MAG: hypothetical protein U0X91_20670 [Spirosomataceae bacterium]
MEKNPALTPKSTLNVVRNTATAADLQAQIEKLQQEAKAAEEFERAERERTKETRYTLDMGTLDILYKELRKLDAAAAMSGKMSLDEALKLAEKQEKIRADIDEIETEWGLKDHYATAETPEPKPKPYGISTTKAIWVLIGLFAVCCLLTGWLGSAAIADPMNPIGQSMMKNAPLRALVAFDMTFLTLLVAIFFIWLFFNDLFTLWHNRIQSERNLSTLLTEAPAWAVLFFLLGSFFLIMWLFANYYLTAYA